MGRKKRSPNKPLKTPVRNKRKVDLIVSPVENTEIINENNIVSATLANSTENTNKKSKTMTSTELQNNAANVNNPWEPIYSPGTVPSYTILGTNDTAAQNASSHPSNTNVNNFSRIENDTFGSSFVVTPVRAANINPNASTFEPPIPNVITSQSCDGRRSIHNPFHPDFIIPPPIVTASSSQQENDQRGQMEPPWVQVLLSKFYTRMDSIEDKLDTIINRVCRLESEISAIPPLKEKVNELEKSVEFLCKSYDTVRGELKANYQELKKLESESNSRVLNETHRRVSELECRSMRDNLLFTGVPEQSRENAEQTIKEIIKTKMGIRHPVEFERVHRVGYHSTSGRPRTIVAKFSRFKDREMIRTNARFLKGTNIGIHEQFSKETNDKRKVLYPKFKCARENNQYAKLILDYLIIDNQKFIVNSKGSIERDPSYSKPPPPRGKVNNNQTSYDRTDRNNSFTGPTAAQATDNQRRTDGTQYNNR